MNELIGKMIAMSRYKKLLAGACIQILIVLTGCAQGNKKYQELSDHLESSDSSGYNRLDEASSPYLRQHADNPVDWYEWGEEALQKAAKNNKPIIISIGYAACHWCHVMERETFSDTVVAKFMNEHFISVKVDREERPDVDQIYMDAAVLINGRGGWPLNAFALPDGRPFYAGTYFPRDQWFQLLQQLVNVYQTDHDKVLQQATAVTNGIKSNEIIATKATDEGVSLENYETIFSSWQSSIDYEWGGYGRAPKFPLPVGWEFLLQYHYITGDKKALRAVTATLDKMALGGIYDQIGGGFARYSTDGYWKVPHFEKMLYDNGQLISLYAHAYQLTGKKLYAGRIEETLNFVERELMSPEGGFYSSLNADSEGEEGKFYVWTQEEINAALDSKTASIVSEYYQVSHAGNWEHGKNILFPKMTKEEFAQKNKLPETAFDKMLSNANKKLFNARGSRIRPTTDDKVLTAWNALMLKGYINSYQALGKPEYLQLALKNAAFLEKRMINGDKGLWRNYKNGKASIPGFLDDYANLAEAFIDLYQVTFNIHWLQLAETLTGYAIEHFYDEKSGMFFYTSDQSAELIARKMEITDNVIAASNSVIAHNLFRLGHYYDKENCMLMARTMLVNVIKDIPKGGPYYANWARLFGLMASEPYDIAIMGEESLRKSLELQRHYLPSSLFMGGEEENLPLLEMKLVTNKTIIYVCKNKVCKLPVTEVSDAIRLIRGN